jgi:hypothetical protein
MPRYLVLLAIGLFVVTICFTQNSEARSQVSSRDDISDEEDVPAAVEKNGALKPSEDEQGEYADEDEDENDSNPNPDGDENQSIDEKPTEEDSEGPDAEENIETDEDEEIALVDED